MRIARFDSPTGRHWGFVDGDVIRAVGLGPELIDVIGDDDLMTSLSRSSNGTFDLSEVHLLAPLEIPPQFIGVGLNYRDHAAEAGSVAPTEPVTFGFLRSAIVGPGEAICLPPFTSAVDWEAEMAIVIGRGGKDIAASDALSHVAGYTIVNDVSARDLQVSEGQWSRAKSFDGFKPMGPWIVTTAEVGPAADLDISLTVNGVTKQASNTRELIFDVPYLVSHLSRATTLLPGAVISTGTPAGVGSSRQPPEYLKAGDEVSISIDGIGILTNPVVDGP
jgi:2-keto-4-pentenoate hydratase/2-oxohepta-3-ene-1,7-dioic acid hydratase in catechol pathway